MNVKKSQVLYIIKLENLNRWRSVFHKKSIKNTIAGSVGRNKASPLPLSVCLQTTY